MAKDLAAYMRLAGTLRELCVLTVEIRKIAAMVRPPDTGVETLLARVADSAVLPLKLKASEIERTVERANTEATALPVCPSHEQMVSYAGLTECSYAMIVVNMAYPPAMRVLTALKWKGGQSPDRWRKVCDDILSEIPAGVDWANELLPLVRSELNDAARWSTQPQTSYADAYPPVDLPEVRLQKLASMLLEHHFDSAGRPVPGVATLSLEDVRHRIEQQAPGGRADGWSTSSIRTLFQKLLEHGHAGYRVMARSEQGLQRLRELLIAEIGSEDATG